MRLDHVQVSCPPGGEEVARAFYRDALGMTEVEKPELLKARGGCWFREGRRRCTSASSRTSARRRRRIPRWPSTTWTRWPASSKSWAIPVTWDNETIPGRRRFHTADGHGNRVEIV